MCLLKRAFLKIQPSSHSQCGMDYLFYLINFSLVDIQVSHRSLNIDHDGRC